LQAALQQIRSIVAGIAEAPGDPQAEKIRRVKIGVVQGIDVGAEAFA